VGVDLGSPSPWVAAVRSALDPADLALLGQSFGTGTPSFVPDAVLPVPGGHSAGFDDEAERVLDETAVGLEAEIHAAGLAGHPPWSYVAKAPRRWAEAHLAALRRAWQAVEPLWHRAGSLLDREVERVGAALASGSLPHLLDGLSRKGYVTGDRWYPSPGAAPAVLLPGTVLQPMLAGPRARLLSGVGGIGYIAYPLPGAGRLALAGDGNGTSRPPRETRLGALLGEPRADILRRLDRPTPAGALAVDLHFAPSAITHHLNALARAGLVRRQRDGRHVLASRSARGSALLQLYEP
jgi:DNA-binding transcriptional ArsR family regulator